MSPYLRLILLGLLFMILALGCQTADPAPWITLTTQIEPTKTEFPATITPTSSPPTATEIPSTVTVTAQQTFTLTPSPSPTSSPVEEIKNIEYITVGQRQELDLYWPNEFEGQRPVILMLHEGNGRKEQFISWGRDFARQGYAVVASNYRGWPNYSYPQDLADAFCALAWIHAQADEYNFDREHVFVLGRSAGGTLAALLGVVDDPDKYLGACPYQLPESIWVQGVITFTGIFDYVAAAQSTSELRSYATALLGGTSTEKAETWAEASAINWIDGSEPAFLIIHGGNDQNIPPVQSTDFAQALQAAGVAVDLVIVPDADHAQITGSAESAENALLFLSELVEKE